MSTVAPNPDHIAERAWALIEMRRWKEAIAEAQRALMLSPRHFNALYNLSVALRRNGESRAAEQAARTLVGYYPNSAAAYNMLSRTLKDQRRYQDAIAVSRESVRLSPNDADMWINLSDVLMSNRQYEEGVEACKKATELNPNAAMAHNNYAVGLEELKRDDEAEAEYRKAMALDPLNPLFHSNLAWLMHKRKQYKSAAAHFHNAIRLEPTNKEYQRNLDKMLRMAFPGAGWITALHVALTCAPFVLFFVLLVMGYFRIALPLFVLSLAAVIVYAIFWGAQVEQYWQARYLQRKLATLPTAQSPQPRAEVEAAAG